MAAKMRMTMQVMARTKNPVMWLSLSFLSASLRVGRTMAMTKAIVDAAPKKRMLPGTSLTGNEPDVCNQWLNPKDDS
jgi:hypothetical protein